MMQGGCYRWVVDIPFLEENNVPTTAHFSAPFLEWADNLLVQSYDDNIMSSHYLFCEESSFLVEKLTVLE